MGIYLGLDSSTQSLSAICIDTDKNSIVYENSVNFGKDLPEYNSPNGFLEHPDPLIKHSNPIMWVEALDKLFSIMKSKKVAFILANMEPEKAARISSYLYRNPGM